MLLYLQFRFVIYILVYVVIYWDIKKRNIVTGNLWKRSCPLVVFGRA